VHHRQDIEPIVLQVELEIEAVPRRKGDRAHSLRGGHQLGGSPGRHLDGGGDEERSVGRGPIVLVNRDDDGGAGTLGLSVETEGPRLVQQGRDVEGLCDEGVHPAHPWRGLEHRLGAYRLGSLQVSTLGGNVISGVPKMVADLR